MSLLSILRPPSRISIHPDLRSKLLQQIRTRYKEELEPRIWRLYLTEDPSNEFPLACYTIIKDVLRKQINSPDDVTSALSDELFDASQEYFGEISPEFQLNLNFVDTLINKSEVEIGMLFPDCGMVFGDSATTLLNDLAFQNRVYQYKISSDLNLADVRRMINISGQVVEDIFSKKIVFDQWMLGEISGRLKNFTKGGGADREEFFRKVPFGKALLGKHFIERIHRLNDLRRKYSHGATDATNYADDFDECIRVLLEDKFGILQMLYQHLSTRKE